MSSATLRVPYEPLPKLPAPTRRALEREALRSNDRYLLEVIERYAFCPFAKEGRVAGETRRSVYIADSPSPEPLLALMEETIASGVGVAQVILPLVEVGHEEWTELCRALTAAGHARLGCAPVLAVAPLHPELPFGLTPTAMVPLFRRSPDPTIQWVRLDGLHTLYADRSADDVYIDPEDLGAYLAEFPKGKPDLYGRICSTNAAMAKRLGIPHVVELLAEIAADGRERYTRVLLSEEGGGE